MNSQDENVKIKIIDYLICLEEQVCYSNDCLTVIQAIIDEAKTTGECERFNPYTQIVYNSLMDALIITTSKLFDAKNKDDIISINSLSKTISSNLMFLPENWQQENYVNYFNEYHMNNCFVLYSDKIPFVSLNESVDVLNISINEHRNKIDNIIAQRNKIYAHNDVKYNRSSNLSKIQNDYPIGFEDIKTVLKIANTFLHNVAISMGRTPLSANSLFI